MFAWKVAKLATVDLLLLTVHMQTLPRLPLHSWSTCSLRSSGAASCQLMEKVGGNPRVQERQHTKRVSAGRSQLASLQLVQQVTIKTHSSVRRCHLYWRFAPILPLLFTYASLVSGVFQAELHPGRRDGSGEDHPVHHAAVRSVRRRSARPLPGHRSALHHHQLGEGVLHLDRHECHCVPWKPRQPADDPAVWDVLQRRQGEKRTLTDYRGAGRYSDFID